jgi:Glycosyl hydrolases family 16
MLPHWSELETSAARYTIGDGSLKLLIERDQGPWLPGRDANNRASNLQTGHFSGPRGSRVGQFRFDPEFVVSEDLPPFRSYVPQYGFFEIRLRAVPVVGYHVALWMIGFDEPHAAEIRVFEIHGAHVGSASSRIDYGVLAWDDPSMTDETFEEFLPIDAAEFHVYAIEWTPTHIDFFVDGVCVRRVAQSPRYPMQFMLGLYERPDERRDDGPSATWPRVCEVDYFRGYRPIDGYPTGPPAPAG